MRDLSRYLTLIAASLTLVFVGCGDDDASATTETTGTETTGTETTGTETTGTDTTGTDTTGTDTTGTDTTGVSSAAPTWAILTFMIDDSANKSYTAADGLAWKGSFAYDATANELTFDGAWSGPFPMLYDDGPISAGGHEAEDQVAGDSIWGVQVQMLSPAEAVTLEYGAISGSTDGSDGSWIWTKDANGTVEIPAASTDTIAADGLTIAKWGNVDLKVSLDTANLDASFNVEIQKIALKGSAWGWTEVELTDDNADGVYDFVLSEVVGQGDLKHAGLLNPGAEPEFVFVINDIEYKVGGKPPAAEGGVSAAVWLGGEWVAQEITYNDKDNTIITVPWAPMAGTVPVNFTIDDSANQTYDATDGLAWKGSMSYDAQTRMVSLDASWGGPFAMLYDDGPWTQGGHEPAGATADDHVWGVTVFVAVTDAEQSFEYGAISGSVDGSDGDWIWQGSNGTFVVPANATAAVDAAGLVIPEAGTIDLRLELDTAGLDASFAVAVDKVEVKGSGWGWQLRACVDDGTQGDTTAGDGIYTFLLSTTLGKHDGLFMDGDKPEFIFQINDVEYKVGGAGAMAGVSAWSDSAGPGADACMATTGDCQAETISVNPDNNNTMIVVGTSDES